MTMQAILFFFLALFSSRDSRIVYSEATPVYSGNSPEIVMVGSTKASTYRFAASIETQPGEGCEANTVLYFVRGYIGAGGMPGVQRQEITIRKGGTVTGVAEIPAAVFRVKAGSRISYHVEYMVGGRCKTRPMYRVFPVLEQIGNKSKKEKP